MDEISFHQKLGDKKNKCSRRKMGKYETSTVSVSGSNQIAVHVFTHPIEKTREYK